MVRVVSAAAMTAMVMILGCGIACPIQVGKVVMVTVNHVLLFFYLYLKEGRGMSWCVQVLLLFRAELFGSFSYRALVCLGWLLLFLAAVLHFLSARLLWFFVSVLYLAGMCWSYNYRVWRVEPIR